MGSTELEQTSFYDGRKEMCFSSLTKHNRYAIRRNPACLNCHNCRSGHRTKVHEVWLKKDPLQERKGNEKPADKLISSEQWQHCRMLEEICAVYSTIAASDDSVCMSICTVVNTHENANQIILQRCMHVVCLSVAATM